MPQPDRWDLVFKRDDLTAAEVRDAPSPRLKPGEVCLAVERFGLTTNNVTYARFEEPGFSYWDTFPGPEGYGRVPVWGFARVESSRHPEITEGSRYYGLMPMSTHHVVAPERTPRGFADTTPQRHFLPPWYWNFELVGEPEARDDLRSVIRPLYPAVLNLASMLDRRAAGGARSVVITSASSKVAIGLAERLRWGSSGLRVVGVTSAGNAAFVERIGVHDAVLVYEGLSSFSATGPVVLVDFTGDPGRLAAVCGRLADELCQVTLVGFTHPQSTITPPPLPGPEPEFFFTPLVEAAAIEEEGAERYHARYTEAEERFIGGAASWLTVRHAQGPAAIAEVFGILLAGKQPPDTCHVLRP